MNNNRNISTFSPFITFCQHVIPLAYDESMSYYETLCALRDYLVNTVIPAINNNAGAVTELQDKYTEFTNNINNTVNDLESYIDNYFNNLDVQTEINNKLDEMAKSGELQDIIAQYLELASVLAFNTRADLKSANNLNNGSFTYCFGKDTYNDGYGNFYKIRQSINTDVADDDNIIALTNYPNLVAEKMPDKYLSDSITTLTNNLNNLSETVTDNYETLNNKIENFEKQKICLVIGDSWTSDSSAGRNLRNEAESWVNTFKNIFNKNFINVSENAAGFVNVGDESALSTFVTQYTTYINLETTNKSLLDTIIIFGGQNDIYNNKSLTDIKAAIDNLATAINENTPHAKVYLAYGNMQNLVTTNNYRALINAVLEYASTTYNWTCTNASGWLIGGSTNLYANQSHQNAEGNKRIISMMNTFLFGGDGISVPVTVSNFKVNDQSVSDYTFSQNQIIYKPFQGLLQGTLYWTFTTGTYNQMTAGGHLYCTFDTDLKGGSDYDKFLPSIMYAASDGNQESLVGRCSLTNYNNNNVYKVNMGCYNAATNNQALVVTSITFNVSLII